MAKDKITVSFSCKNCGGTLETAEDNPTDNSIVKCKSCGQTIGTYGQIKAKAFEATKVKVTGMFKDAFKGIKGVKFKKR